MKAPLVSVIIPNYCHANYLDQRILSVLDQTYQDFEVIILDDCSPDDGASRAVIEKYRNNPHVTHIEYNEVNSGSTFKQWHKGFELAKGELIWIAESDDYCEKEFLQTAIDAYLTEKDVSVVFCTSQLVDENNNLIPPYFNHTSEIIKYEGNDFIKRRMLYSNAINNASSAVFSKEKVLNIATYYMTYIAVGDYLFWILLAETGKIIHIANPLNSFRQHLNKVSYKKQIDGTGSKEVFKVIQYLKSRGYVSSFQYFIISLIHIKETYDLTFESEELRSNILRLWDYNGKISYKTAKILLIIFYRLKLNLIFG